MEQPVISVTKIDTQKLLNALYESMYKWKDLKQKLDEIHDKIVTDCSLCHLILKSAECKECPLNFHCLSGLGLRKYALKSIDHSSHAVKQNLEMLWDKYWELHRELKEEAG